MKGIMSLFVFAAVFPGLSYAVDSRDLYGDINVRPVSTVKKEIKSPVGMYMGIHGDLSLLSWKNEYETGADSGHDTFSFKPVIGVDLVTGYQFNEYWRSDLEFGYVGRYSESETEYDAEYSTERTDFNLETFYMTLNGYREIKAGLYAGIGAGAAAVRTKIDSSVIKGKSATHISPMGALMLGWSHNLDERVSFDLRYRFSLFHGGKLDLDAGDGTQVKTEVGFIKDNTISAGIRYSF